MNVYLIHKEIIKGHIFDLLKETYSNGDIKYSLIYS